VTGHVTDVLREFEVLADVLSLMTENVIERPCRYRLHVWAVWFNVAGRPVCGVCHPKAAA
jgi:hypothetical protein